MPAPGFLGELWGIGKSVGEEAVHAVRSNESVTKNSLFNEVKASFLRRRGNLRSGISDRVVKEADAAQAEAVTAYRNAGTAEERASAAEAMSNAVVRGNNAAHGNLGMAESAYANVRAGMGAAKDFYWGNHDGWTRAKRIGATAGISFAGAGTMRHITGSGGYFHDSNGDFDIAGIPFF